MLFQDLREPRVFRKEAVARMHRLGARDLAGRQQARNVEIAVGGAPCFSMTARTSPNSTGCPFSKKIAVTVPERGAGIWFMVFIASMMRSVSPWLTRLPTSMKGGEDGSGER